MQGEVLFKGLTRPPLIMGIPITPFFIAFTSNMLLAVWFKIEFLAFFPFIILIMKGLTKHDDFIFRLLFLKMKMFTPGANKKHFGAKTYSAQKYRKIEKNIEYPKLTILDLDKNPDFEKFIPYSSLLTPEIVMTKDFALLATFKIYGVDFEIEDTVDVEMKNNSLNGFFKSFSSEPVSFYFHQSRKNKDEILKGKYKNKYLNEINDRYYSTFEKGSLKTNELFLTLIFDPYSSKLDKSNFKKITLDKKIKDLKNKIIKMREYIGVVESSLKDFKCSLLKTYTEKEKKYSKQLKFYNFLINGEYEKVAVLDTPLEQYLTGNLNNIQFSHNTGQLNFNNSKKKFFRMIEIKDFTNMTYAGILDTLMYLDVNYTITQSFSPMSKPDAKYAVKKQAKQLKSTEDDALSQIEEIDDALDELTSGEITFGKYHFSIIVYGDTLKEAKNNTNDVISELNNIGFMATLSDIALPANYFAQFPTNFALRPRVNIISSKNFASLIALHNFPKGKKEKNCWGDAVTILKTPNKQPYFFNFHEVTKESKDDFGKFYLGNTLILGQSGGGKTVLQSFLIAQSQKFDNKLSFPEEVEESKKKMTTIFLDKDKGALGNILASGGEYIEVDSGKPTGFNPFKVQNTKENIRNLQNLIKILVTRNGEILTTLEEQNLQNAIESVMNNFEIDERDYGISLLLENLTESIEDNNSLRSRLALWSKNKKFGWVFDNKDDRLKFSDKQNIFGIDGTDFLDDDEVNAPISYYILWRTMSLIDGRRFILFIDEAWKWIANPLIADEVKNKFKTIRKQNGFFVLATQSPADFLDSPIAKPIIEQSATMLLLANPKAKHEEYVKGFNLTDEEYEVIKGFDVTKYQFLIKKGNERSICQLDLSALKELISILSTGTADIDSVKEIYSTNESLETKYENLKKYYSRSEK